MYLFFDTETNGLPRSYKAPINDFNNWPRLVQIAWIRCGENRKEQSALSYIVRPEGFTIPDRVAALHGITTERALAEGQSLRGVLTAFAKAVMASETIVAHNMFFDKRIVGCEFLRCSAKNFLAGKKQICTMLSSRRLFNKWAKLSALHKKLFNESFEGAHDALADTRAMSRCFWELRKRRFL